jgi:hypothetical protein
MSQRGCTDDRPRGFRLTRRGVGIDRAACRHRRLVALRILPALVVVVQATRPRGAAIAFLLGSMAGLTAATTASMQLSHDVDFTRVPSPPPVVVACGAISLGAALLALAGIAWIRRKTIVSQRSWVARIVHITPVAAGILGLVLTTANLKVTVANAAAGNVIGGAEQLGVLGTVATLGAYILIASSTVIVPTAGYLIAAQRVERALSSARAWVDRRAAVLVIVVSGLCGAALMIVGVIAL